MTRLEFCELLVNAKQASGKSTNGVSFDLRMQWSTLRRFEKGVNNPNMRKIFDYLAVVNHQLSIVSNGKEYCFVGYDSLLKWVVSQRAGKYSQRQLATMINKSFVMVARIESQTSMLTLDVFLQIMEVFQCTISIKYIK